ncbi:MAG: hypothetical protein GWN86_06845 [Desulfobacterales bacterium]|nr:hypothetical protein [Desulfobacterales bacterium]
MSDRSAITYNQSEGMWIQKREYRWVLGILKKAMFRELSELEKSQVRGLLWQNRTLIEDE